MTYSPAVPPKEVDANSATERALAGIWRRLLGVARVDRQDDFFALGGDSFRAGRLAAEVRQAFGAPATAALAFDRPVLAGQAAWIDAHASTPAPAPATTGADPELALTTQQLEFLDWMAATEPPRDPGAISTAIRLREPLDPELLRRALDALTRRHEPLRLLRERTPDGRLQLSVAAELPAELELVTARDEAHAAELARDERERVGDLVADPLVRALLIRLAPNDAVLVLSVHHFVFDGWSLGVLLRELGRLVSAFAAGRPDPLAPPALHHAGYCAWTAQQWDRNREFWQQRLAGAPRALEPFPGRLRTDRFSRRRHGFELSAAELGALRLRARALGATPFMAVAACWTRVLADWTGLTDLVLMSPVPGRTAAEHDALIGCLVQSLLLRVDTAAAPDFPTLLGRVRTTALEAATHQFHAYHETAPLVPFPARIHYENWGSGPFLPGVRSEPFPLPREQEGLDWPTPGGELDLSTPELICEERPDGSLSAAVVYNHHAFAPDTAARLAAAFRTEVAAAAGPQESTLA
ncbi:condensation domain-containing protein [Kitasatospora sp. NPDC006697]|uniref:condensation domain-containing protein n=1 Tax=Kitasatospora sp. NPDC006697 TaxID=3364020 RepID=UPI0036765B81